MVAEIADISPAAHVWFGQNNVSFDVEMALSSEGAKPFFDTLLAVAAEGGLKLEFQHMEAGRIVSPSVGAKEKTSIVFLLKPKDTAAQRYEATITLNDFVRSDMDHLKVVPTGVDVWWSVEQRGDRRERIMMQPDRPGRLTGPEALRALLGLQSPAAE
ncbi:MAG: hypothetical protein AB7G06_08765 [Bdellovibrionales bacterium]